MEMPQYELFLHTMNGISQTVCRMKNIQIRHAGMLQDGMKALEGFKKKAEDYGNGSVFESYLEMPQQERQAELRKIFDQCDLDQKRFKKDFMRAFESLDEQAVELYEEVENIILTLYAMNERKADVVRNGTLE